MQTDKEPAQQEPQQEHTQPSEVTFDATKIALPFADTPIIRRNKEMRKTNAARRSSLGMRGRRASSLIDTGKSNGNKHTQRRPIVNADRKSAMPHDEVESSEFYKHIASEGLSEPRRMKQLLTWCATRALGEKPSFSTEDGNAILAGLSTPDWDRSHRLTLIYSPRDSIAAAKRLLDKVRDVRLVQQGMLQ